MAQRVMYTPGTSYYSIETFVNAFDQRINSLRAKVCVVHELCKTERLKIFPITLCVCHQLHGLFALRA